MSQIGSIMADIANGAAKKLYLTVIVVALGLLVSLGSVVMDNAKQVAVNQAAIMRLENNQIRIVDALTKINDKMQEILERLPKGK